MNSYNENLHSTVVASLQNVELERKVLKSQVNASMFTLYHAEGALITAEEQLTAAKSTLDFKTKVKEQAVNDSNISTNLLASANQANQYLNQSITNTAVSASNVQIATNAIVRLAGDIGTIYTIVNAADFKSEIYAQAEQVRDLMNDTAYTAEVTSQYAMEASMLTSEVSASTVLDKSKSANAAMANLLGIATADFDTTSQIVTTDSTTLAAAYVSEKLAEGALEDISVDYSSTRNAYNVTNKELNINLKVPKLKLTNTSFTVTFDLMKGPFLDVTDPKKPFYPPIVQDYYIIVVKERKKLTFSISNAESLLYNDKTGQYVHVKMPSKIIQITGVDPTSVTTKIDFLNMPGGGFLSDSDGDPVALGQNYVVFVMAIYKEEYKRTLNDFDNFLSAPSKTFCMTNKLKGVKAQDIWTGAIVSDDDTKPQPAIITDVVAADEKKMPKSAYTHYLIFEVRENPDYPVAYNCMFLPIGSDLTGGMLTKTSLTSILDDEIMDIEQISELYDPEIAALQATILVDKQQNEYLNTEIVTLTNKIKAISGSNPEKEKLEAELDQAQAQQALLTEEISTSNTQLSTLVAQRAQAVIDLTIKDGGSPGFFFNLTIAEQVSAGNYSVAQPLILGDEGTNELNAIKTAAKIKEEDEEDKKMPAGEQRFIYSTLIGPETTDNFGNPLIKGRSYIPVILSVSAAEDNNLAMFTNAMSEIKGVNPLIYKDPTKK